MRGMKGRKDILELDQGLKGTTLQLRQICCRHCLRLLAWDWLPCLELSASWGVGFTIRLTRI